MSSSEQTTENPLAENNAESETVAAEKEALANESPAKKRSALLLIVIVLLLASAGGGFYLWQTLSTSFNNLQADSQRYADHLSQLSTKLKDSEAALTLHDQQLNQLNTLLNQQQNQFIALSDSHKTLLKTAKNVFDISHRNQYQWSLAEVSYLLSLANQRLIISRDIQSATAALKAANYRLHDLSDPSLLNIRKKIADEVTQLSLLKLADVNGIAFSLDNMTALIELLPFKTAQQKHTESIQSSNKIEIASFDKDALLTPLWDQIKSLVTIKKHHRAIQTTETAVDKSDIDNQLRYRLETARVALISSNNTVFQNEISHAIKLVNVYYSASDNRVNSLFTELDALSKVNLLPELPNITGSWSMLQKIIASKGAVDNLNKNNKGTRIQ